MQKLLSQLSVRLIFKQLKVATVESCTGGGIGKTLTDPAGSSAWFAGGLITYTNESKTQLAGVPEATIKRFGAVSEEVVDAMARGAQKHFANCITVAVSGIAGPDGGSKDKPVGTVCIATCVKDTVNAKKYCFKGDRNTVRQSTIKQALEMVLEQLEKI